MGYADFHAVCYRSFYPGMLSRMYKVIGRIKSGMWGGGRKKGRGERRGGGQRRGSREGRRVHVLGLKVAPLISGNAYTPTDIYMNVNNSNLQNGLCLMKHRKGSTKIDVSFRLCTRHSACLCVHTFPKT